MRSAPTHENSAKREHRADHEPAEREDDSSRDEHESGNHHGRGEREALDPAELLHGVAGRHQRRVIGSTTSCISSSADSDTWLCSSGS